MKTKLIGMLLVLSLLVGAVAVLSSCGECKHENMPAEWVNFSESIHQRICPDCGEVESEPHKMEIDLSKCDPAKDEYIFRTCTVCGREKKEKNNIDAFKLDMELKTYPWETTALTMSIGDSSNGGELESGGRAYVSGEWDGPDGVNFETGNTVSKVDSNILSQILKRNRAAQDATKVNVTYTYLGGTYNWGTVLPQIARENAAANTPDVYYNFIYDMVGASIKGYFKNIQGNEYLAPFYDSFSNGEVDEAGLPVAANGNTRGYNWDYMKDLSFSTQCMYLIASDYSFDISRAYFIMPVNGTLLQSVASVTGDVNGYGEVGDELDFIAMVEKGDWTWAKIAEYTEAVKSGDSAKGGYSVNNSDCVAGFAMSTMSGLSSTAVMYTGNLSIVTRTVGARGEYLYDYASETPETMTEIFKMAADYIGTPGAGSSLNDPGGTGGVILYGGSTAQVDTMFRNDRLLVNTACVLGVIETQTYQDMWNESATSGNGFVITPAAKTSTSQENYRTLVHNIGKVFAVSSKADETKTNAACAFINHQTVNSGSILAEYFTWSLGHSSAATEANVSILLNMSNNLKFGIDKVVEDALGILWTGKEIDDPFNPGQKMDGSHARWHTYMITDWDLGEGVDSLYKGLYLWKTYEIISIQDQFTGKVVIE